MVPGADRLDSDEIRDELHHRPEPEIAAADPNVLPALGNYLIGPNCVLPTGGHARTWSPLSVHDFMKRTSIAQVTRAGYRTLAPYAHRLATYEGFDAHANAVSPLREGHR